jgi:MFS family permease
MSGQFHLLGTRRFLPFFGTQFLGAFNDNLFKNALVVLLTFKAASWTTLKPELLANMAAGIFILPFFLFSATAGQLADKYDKARLARLVKMLEIIIMLVAGAGFALRSLPWLMSALFLFGVHSTLFGPVKYAILPQHLRRQELVGGNALVEAGTFAAILIGTICGSLLAGLEQGTVWITLAGLVVAVAGYFASRKIPVAPAPQPQLRVNPNPFFATWRNIGYARENRTVYLSILGISWFWLYGALFLAQFPAYAKNFLGGSETTVTLLLATFTIGIGIGSLLCERLSGKMLEIGLVPIGSIGLTLFGLDLAMSTPAMSAQHLSVWALLGAPGIWRVLLDLAGLGLFGGLFIVPLYALVQLRSDPAYLARIIAGNNIMNALFMVVGALAAGALLGGGMSVPGLFGVAAVCNAVMAIYLYKRVPEFVVRFLLWLLVHTVYRLEKRGIDNIPESGAAVLICSHASYVDAPIIAAASPRPVRFVIDHHVRRTPLLSFVLEQSRAIPIASGKEPAALPQQGFDAVALALAQGELVAMFLEDGITASPETAALLAGITQIAARVPIIEVTLSGLRGCAHSRDAAMTRSGNARPLRKITLDVGRAVQAEDVGLCGQGLRLRLRGESA